MPEQRVTVGLLRQELQDFASGALREELKLCLLAWNSPGGRAQASDFEAQLAAAWVPPQLDDTQALDSCDLSKSEPELNGAAMQEASSSAVPFHGALVDDSNDHDWSTRQVKRQLARETLDAREDKKTQFSRDREVRKSHDWGQESMMLSASGSSDKRLALRMRQEELFSLGRMHKGIEKFIYGSYFESAVLSLVFVNAVAIGWQTELMSSQRLERTPVEFEILEYCLLVFFTFEVVMKVMVNWRVYFRGRDYIFNIFDTLLVTWDLCNLFLERLMSESGTENMSRLRLIRLVRLIRIMRSVRIMKMVGEVRAVIAAIAHSLKPLLGGVFFLTLCSYVMGIFFTAVALPYRLDKDKTSVELEKHYKSLFTCMLYMFQSLTGGIDWNDMVAPLIEDVSPFVGLMYCGYVIFCLLAVMNVITGSFVSTAMRAVKEDQDTYTILHLEHIFDMLDEAKTGVIDREAFKSHLETSDMQELFRSIDLDPSEADCVFKLLDMDNTGFLDCSAFLNGCLRLRGSAKALDLLLLLRETTRQYQKQTVLVQDMQLIQEKQLTKYKENQERQHHQILAMLIALRTMSSKPSPVRTPVVAKKLKASKVLD